LARLARLDEYVSRLKRFEDMELNKYLADYDIQAVVERNLQLSIQICIDIANYIIARKKLTFPAEQENIFSLLGKESILTQELAGRIKGMVSFRNILVHDYTDIDSKKVHELLKKGLKDFSRFALEVVAYLENNN
jgi:uncharacterized protein YutE (UPF0331/DUF86 family)